MGKKAFLRAPARSRASPCALPVRVLLAAGLPARGRQAEVPRSRAGRSTSPVVIGPVMLSPGRLGPASLGPVILGIDPGTLVVGYGAVRATASGPRLLAAGVLRARRRAGVPERLGEIQVQLSSLLDRIRPSVVVVERGFASKNVQSALRIGEGRGVALACAAAFGAEVLEIPPAAAKKALVGHGAAHKSQVARMVAALLGLRESPRPLDASDALALALAHVLERVG